MLISRYTLLNCVSEEGNCLIFYQIGLEIRGPKLVTSDFRFQWLRPELKQGLQGMTGGDVCSPTPKVDAKGNNGKVCLNQICEVENMDVAYKLAYISISVSASIHMKKKLT